MAPKMFLHALAGSTFVLSLASFALAANSPLPAATPLVTDGAVRVDVADFEGNILRIPEDKRAPFRVSYDRVAAVVDNVFITRALAQRARDAGLERDPAVQARLRQVQDAFLADLYVQKLEKDAVAPDLEKRARELYIADRERFVEEEEVHVQQILVGTSCRTKEAALQLAKRAYDEARAGKEDFMVLAARYSDEGEKTFKGGDIGTGPVKKLVEPVREALAKLKKGELSEPVESQFGFHVLKLIDRKVPQPRPFEIVKASIIEGERARIQRKRVEDAVVQIRSSPTVVTHRENVEKLVVGGGADREEFTRRAKEAQKGPPTNVQPLQQPPPR